MTFARSFRIVTASTHLPNILCYCESPAPWMSFEVACCDVMKVSLRCLMICNVAFQGVPDTERDRVANVAHNVVLKKKYNVCVVDDR